MSDLTGRITSPGAVSGAIIGSGPPGAKGDPGYTPVRGTDYWTDADVAEIKGYIDGQMGPIDTALDTINGEVV